jgi:NAD(P)H-hydrate epimerase
VNVLPEWLSALPDAESMRRIDRWAIEQQGVPGLELMERAGAGVARAVERIAPDGPVAVVCGKGNNGGDGLVAARLLREADREVTVVCVSPPQELEGDARVNLERLPGERPLRLDGTSWEQEDGRASSAAGGVARLGNEAGARAGGGAMAGALAVVDGLLGTGFRLERSEGAPTGAVGEAIEAINALGAKVVSVDVPSGVDASTGVVGRAAVRASLTVTFHAAKPGLWINPGKGYAGEVETIDIGIPRGAPREAEIGLIERSVVELLPRREATSTKFTSGHLLVVGGSRGLTGAPRMTAQASMRAGAGYVTVCVPASLQELLAGAASPEVMTRGLPEKEGALEASAVASVLESGRRGALALGPGLGRSEQASAFARALALEADLPMVLDADGIGAHAGHLAELRGRTEATVLTPHAGELGRLLDLHGAEIDRERLRHARAAAEQARAVVVLKGDDTLIADPSGRVAVSRGGAPALATAGTGDVLTGVIGAFLAQGVEPFAAAAAGVWLHAAAGREAARRLGGAEGVIASDVIAALASVRGEVAGSSQTADARVGGE